jgi:hypothetical protein
MKFNISKDWTPEERLAAIHRICSRWDKDHRSHIDVADPRDLLSGFEVIRVLSKLNAETCELNRKLILDHTSPIDVARYDTEYAPKPVIFGTT